MTLHECLNMYIEILGIKWDGWDYAVYAPVSLDDIAELHIVLRNENGRSSSIDIPLGLPLS